MRCDGRKTRRKSELEAWKVEMYPFFFSRWGDLCVACSVVLCVLEVRLAISLLLPYILLVFFLFPVFFPCFFLFFFRYTSPSPDFVSVFACLFFICLFPSSSFFIRYPYSILFPPTHPRSIASHISPPLHWTLRTA